MNVERKIIESVVVLLNKALAAEGDVFGVDHNEATDVVGHLELLLKNKCSACCLAGCGNTPEHSYKELEEILK